MLSGREIPQQIVEYDKNGFVVKFDRGAILKPKEQVVHWEEVLKIDVCMWDCFYYHNIGLCFDYGEKKSVCVDKETQGYQDFLNCITERYPGFNRHNVDEIKAMFPSDIAFPCWERGKRIGDLEARPLEKVIVWKKDGTIFMEWE